MFPWQSGSDGKEETQVVHLNPLSGVWEPDLSHNQRHVNAAIFYVQGGTTQEGIRMGVMSGTLDLIQRGFMGSEIGGDVLRFEPRLRESASTASSSPCASGGRPSECR